mmetsp:Transcript_26138/g.86145  ORF Transcript_26138/g.86145 Transcript_26138/m.86145 type:complete len:132 (+) Transcript_26138:136-531(+)
MPFEQPSANEAGLTLPPEALHAAFENPLLYWQERSQWMWHKKWCLPRLSVTVALDEAAPLGNAPLVAMVMCGTLSAGGGAEQLENQGLTGQCTQRLLRRSRALLEASFSSLHLQHTSRTSGSPANTPQRSQ